MAASTIPGNGHVNDLKQRFSYTEQSGKNSSQPDAGGKPLNTLLLDTGKKTTKEDLPLLKRTVRAETAVESQFSEMARVLRIRGEIMEAADMEALTRLEAQLELVSNADNLEQLRTVLENKRKMLGSAHK